MGIKFMNFFYIKATIDKQNKNFGKNFILQNRAKRYPKGIKFRR